GVGTRLRVVNLFEGVTEPGGASGAVDRALGGQISRLIAEGEITGEPATVTVIHANGNGNLKAQRVAVVGLGKQSDTEQERLENLRVAAAVAARKVRDLKLESYATIVHGAGIGGFPLDAAARATTGVSVLPLD